MGTRLLRFVLVSFAVGSATPPGAARKGTHTRGGDQTAPAETVPVPLPRGGPGLRGFPERSPFVAPSAPFVAPCVPLDDLSLPAPADERKRSLRHPLPSRRR
jgi:hypothetical protein